MKKIRLILLMIFVLCIYTSCKLNTSEDRIIGLVKIWKKKQVIYPSKTTFTICGEDTLNNYVKLGTKYSIVSYIDSLGCLSCKLQAKAWKDFRNTIDSVSNVYIPVNIFIHYKDDRELFSLLKKENFEIPICLDLNDSLRILNGFPDDMAFRTFLLDEENKVIAIGNPVFNPKVKELYLKIIQGETMSPKNDKRVMQTELLLDKHVINFRSFDWHKEQKGTFLFSNKGDVPLVIEEVVSSCGCTVVDYSKEPVLPGQEMLLNVTYKAEQPEYFSKTIIVYCNVEISPVKLTISGNAK